MPWVYSIEPVSDYPNGDSQYIPHGVKVVKTFYSDSGENMVSVDTTVQEAIAESDTDISEEYYNEVIASLKNQIDLMFSLAAENQLPFVSIGSVFGNRLVSALGDVVVFARERDNE